MSKKILLKPMNLFATPSDWAEIQDRIGACENQAESTVLAMMVWNFACHCANEKHNLFVTNREGLNKMLPPSSKGRTLNLDTSTS